jgi:hypothetical protein
VKTTQQQRDEMRAVADRRLTSIFSRPKAEVDAAALKSVLDDLDELRECLRLMYEDTTRFDDNNDQALQARIAAALKEPHAS